VPIFRYWVEALNLVVARGSRFTGIVEEITGTGADRCGRELAVEFLSKFGRAFLSRVACGELLLN
jgi:hypothetical protein